ncbi:unnamed protein product [Symbiodinium microadriaticum]|nr:unnamed protein product [Symbiodinium microadriaticum]
MVFYLDRRKHWLRKLRQLHKTTDISEGVLTDLLFDNSGLSRNERLMVPTAMGGSTVTKDAEQVLTKMNSRIHTLEKRFTTKAKANGKPVNSEGAYGCGPRATGLTVESVKMADKVAGEGRRSETGGCPERALNRPRLYRRSTPRMQNLTRRQLDEYTFTKFEAPPSGKGSGSKQRLAGMVIGDELPWRACAGKTPPHIREALEKQAAEPAPANAAAHSGHFGEVSEKDRQRNQSAETPPPEMWLEEEAVLPEEYLELKGAIDVSGWGAVEWAGNYTLLHWAAATNHAGLCEHFLRLRADPLVRDDAGRTSLDYAVLHQHKDVAMVMINAVATSVQRPEASVVRTASVQEKAEMSGAQKMKSTACHCCQQLPSVMKEPASYRFVLLLRFTASLTASRVLRLKRSAESTSRGLNVNNCMAGEVGEDYVRRDEYGDIFEDYGFLKRAEAFKGEGNKAFAKERFEKALAEYARPRESESPLTIAYDKSIVIGKKKWNDIVVMRSTLHLNKSTCFYKLKDWQQSLDAALECLVGNHRDEMLFTDPHIRHKLKESVRAKIGSRWGDPRGISCYGHLDFLDKAKDALAKALEACDDQGLIAEISQHSLRLDTLERLQKDKQKKQFAGFWDKFQDRGGYSEGKNDAQEWDKLKYWERFKHVEEYEERYSYVDQDQQQEDPKKGHAAELLHHLPPGAKWDSAVKGLTKKMYRSIDRSFEEYLEKKSAGQVEEASVTEEPGQSPRIEVPPEPKDVVPPRPRRKEETPLAYSPRGARPGARSRAARSPSPLPNPREEYARHYNSYAKQEKAWQDKAAAEALDSEEEQELQEVLVAQLNTEMKAYRVDAQQFQPTKKLQWEENEHAYGLMAEELQHDDLVSIRDRLRSLTQLDAKMAEELMRLVHTPDLHLLTGTEIEDRWYDMLDEHGLAVNPELVDEEDHPIGQGLELLLEPPPSATAAMARLWPLLNGPSRNEGLPLATWRLLETPLRLPSDGVNWPVYMHCRHHLKTATVIAFPNHSFSDCILLPKWMSKNMLPLQLFIVLPLCIVETWLNCLSHIEVVRSVLSHLPLRQANLFMTIAGPLSKLARR